MIRLSYAIWLGAAAVAATVLFQVKDRVQDMEGQLLTVQRGIQSDREAIHVLKAEWSYLNRPGQIEDLARRHLGFERHRLTVLGMGGLLLDIGNVRIPRTIGMKEGPLTDDEHQMMRMHVEYGVEIVKKSSAFGDEVIDMVRYHHERYDGSGYPNGLRGTDIPVYGRIAGVIDCYDAIISRKPYRGPKCAYDAIRELNQLSGKTFQPEVVEQFVQALGMFPTGSLVELNTGEVAIVIEQNRERRLRPNLLMILDENKQPAGSNRILALSKVPATGDSRKARWVVGGYDAGTFDIDPKDYFFGLKGAA